MAARESSAMVKARKMVTEQGLTSYAAAKKVGLTRSAIYMSRWYKEWRDAQKSKTV
jgi:predicted transcriptional regulator